MSHYDELGVSRDATTEQIKKAYRAKSREKHPDKGGPPDDFIPIAKAYEVLSDPDRRILYNSTGQDKRLPIETEVQNILMQGFNEALAQKNDIEIVGFVRGALEKVSNQLPRQVGELKARKKKLSAKRGKIKTKSAVNIVHLIIDAELKNIEGQLLNIEHQIKVTKECLKTLKTYSEDWEAPVPEIYTTADLQSYLSGVRYR